MYKILENDCYDLVKGTAYVFDWRDLDETLKISVSTTRTLREFRYDILLSPALK
jgi:hypothetical protein